MDKTAAIIATRNYGRYLKQCLDSLHKQSRPFDEIIVVDDDSSDETAEICHADPRVKYFRVKMHNCSMPRNYGARAAYACNLLLFVDADNWLDDEYHALLHRAMSEDPRLDVAYGMKRIWDDTPQGPKHLAYFGSEFSSPLLHHQNFIDTCSLIRREAFEEVGGWEHVEALEDWLLWRKLDKAGKKFQLSKLAVLNYRRHNASMTHGARPIEVTHPIIAERLAAWLAQYEQTQMQPL